MHKSTPFTIKVFSSDRDFSRFGVIVSKKVGKTAVIRNKTKRALYSALSLVKDRWPKADYLVIANPPTVDLNQQQVNDKIIQFSFN